VHTQQPDSKIITRLVKFISKQQDRQKIGTKIRHQLDKKSLFPVITKRSNLNHYRSLRHDPGMLLAEQIKYRKHELAYSHTGYSFVAFICSCFGALGLSSIRYLSVLAIFELRQHEAIPILRNQQGLDPLDDSGRDQYRANCFRASSARVAAAIAKATVMRLLALHLFRQFYDERSRPSFVSVVMKDIYI
jgi:hypothetical protein